MATFTERMRGALSAARYRLSDALSSTTALSGIASAIRPEPPTVSPPDQNSITQLAKSITGTAAPKERGAEQKDFLQRAGDKLSQVMRSISTSEGLMEIAEKFGLTTSVQQKGNYRKPVISDKSGNERAAYSLNQTTARVAKATAPNLSALETSQMLNEQRLSRMLKVSAGSEIANSFRPFIDDLRSGNSEGIARSGWRGLIDATHHMQAPKKFEGQDVGMGLTVRSTGRGSEAYLGVSVGVAGPSQSQTLRTMMQYALDNKLSIPPNKNGTAWTAESTPDIEMLNALCGKKTSPFVGGGKPPLAEGSDILLNDEHLVRLSRLSPALSSASLDEGFARIGEKIAAEGNKRAAIAPSAEALKDAQETVAYAKSGNFKSFAALMQDQSDSNGKERERAAAQRPDFKNMASTTSANPVLDDGINGFTGLPNSAPSQEDGLKTLESVSYADLKEMLPDWKPTSKDVFFRQDDPNDPSTLNMRLFVGPTLSTQLREDAKVSVTNRNVDDLSGLSMADLPDGQYNVMMNGGGQTSLEIASGDIVHAQTAEAENGFTADKNKGMSAEKEIEAATNLPFKTAKREEMTMEMSAPSAPSSMQGR